MPAQEPIKTTLQQEFQAEKLTRIIQECDDLSLLKQIAIELLNLNKQKTAIAQWTAKKALQAEKDILNTKNKSLPQ